MISPLLGAPRQQHERVKALTRQKPGCERLIAAHPQAQSTLATHHGSSSRRGSKMLIDAVQEPLTFPLKRHRQTRIVRHLGNEQIERVYEQGCKVVSIHARRLVQTACQPAKRRFSSTNA